MSDKCKKKSYVIRLENPYLNFLVYLNLYTMMLTWYLVDKAIADLPHVNNKFVSLAWVSFCGSKYFIEIGIFKIYEITKKRKLDGSKGGRGYFTFMKISVFVMNLMLFLFIVPCFAGYNASTATKIFMLICLFILWANRSIAGHMAIVTVERMMRAEK